MTAKRAIIQIAVLLAGVAALMTTINGPMVSILLLAIGLVLIGRQVHILDLLMDDRRARGGRVPIPPPSDRDAIMIKAGEARQIADPDEAEALGLNVDARQMRDRSDTN